MQLRLVITGMQSVHAKRALWTALAGVPGVRRADVEVGGARLECESVVDEAALRAVIGALGFTLASVSRELPLA